MLLIRYSNGRILQGILLGLGDQRIRVALKGSDDVTEYRLINQHWVSEDCEVVTMTLPDQGFALDEEEEILEGIVPTGFDRPVARHVM
jgi:hypothetical protein